MSNTSPSLPRLTPSVARLIAVTAVVQLLLETVFTSPGIRAALAMDPAGFISQPWGVVTYLFVHDGVLHLATNMLGLYLFGTAVESRMGSKAFLTYYLYCGVGAALASIVLALLMGAHPVIGASGAVLGVAVAFATYWPEAEILVFPLPIPIRARTLVIGLAVMDLIAARWFPGSTAHEAHLGGMLAGWLFFRVQSLSQRRPLPPPRKQPEQVVMVQQPTSRDTDPRAALPSRQAASRAGSDPVTTELDRVLDKISATGIESLTPEERRFLDEVSKRKQREMN